MPLISMFYGIVVRMYFMDVERHHLPHIHVEYQGSKASYAIASGERLAVELPLAKERLLLAWIELHRAELMADWDLAVRGEEPFRIEPLR